MTEPAGPPERDDRDLLRRAEALVFVADLDAPACSREDAHHLLDVLRLRDGAPVVAADGRGSWRPYAIARPAPAGGRGRVRGRAPGPPGGTMTGLLVPSGAPRREAPAGPALTIGFALQKGDRPEWTVQKLTELGVDRILPLLTERTVVRLEPGEVAARGARLRRVAREAAMQSRRPRLPEVADPMPLADALAELTGAAAGNEPGAAPAPSVTLAEPGGGPLPAAATCVLVGPEGGWSPSELGAGVTLVDLGPSVLRAETAAIVAGTLLAALRSGTVRPA